jgi:hypothetical protein
VPGTVEDIVFFICLLIFSNIALSAQDTQQSYAPLLIREDSQVWLSGKSLYDNNVARILPKGTKVTGRVAAYRDRINSVFAYTASIYYNDERYDIRTSDLSPISGQLPKDWLTASDTQRKWAISYYLDVLRSQNRDMFLNYEKPWIDYNTKEIEKQIAWGEAPGDTKWYDSPFNFESLVFFDAVIIMGGFALCEFFITEVIQFDTGCKITMTGDYWFIEGRNFSWPGTGLPFPDWPERRSFDMIFIPDGGYMDVYLDSLDNKFAVFAKVDNIFLEELENLIHTNTVDLSKITFWPRRADGSMDYPPPADMSGFSADRRTTDRLRLRDNPATASLIVTTLDSGTEVQVLETGPSAVIDGITAPWVRVLSADGYTGWCFSGYLEEIAKPVASGNAERPNGVGAVTVEILRGEVVQDSAKTSAMPFWVWAAIIGGAVAVALAVRWCLR